jgi:parallel beta-helix repeat protein
MKKVIFFLVFLPAATVPVARSQVMVAATDNLQNLVNANPAGTTFTLLHGVHHDSVTSLKNKDTFTGQPGAVENGAEVLTGWVPVSIGGTQYWTAAGGTPLGNTQSSSQCQSGYPGCYLSQSLFVDNTHYTRTTTLSAVAPGIWYFDVAGGDGGVLNNVYLAYSENPNNGHTVEMSQFYSFLASDTATGITVQNLIVEKYGPKMQDGAIHTNASGWLIQNNEIRLNHSAGIAAPKLTGSLTVRSNNIHDNGTVGITGGGNQTGGPTLVTQNILNHNNTDHVSDGFGNGGLDMNGPNMTITYNTVTNNLGAGLWKDGPGNSPDNTLFDHNTVTGNDYDGIRVEISDVVTVTNNMVSNNASCALSDCPAASQIVFSNSSHGTITNNTVIYDATVPGESGIIVFSGGRSCGTGCTVPQGMTVAHNAVQSSATVGNGLRWIAAAIDSQQTFASWAATNMFDFNCYQVPSLPWNDTSWTYGNRGGPNMSFESWQAAGQDVNATLTATACPSPVVISGRVTLSGSLVIQ